MEAIRLMASDRHSVRRATNARCQAVSETRFRLIGERALDLSTEGLLLACDEEVHVGERVLLSIEMPGTKTWIDAEAMVVRVVEGYREGDRGYCAGLRFTAIDFDAYRELRSSLRGAPPPVPMRALRSFLTLTNAPAFSLV
jgi:hypothetical protein